MPRSRSGARARSRAKRNLLCEREPGGTVTRKYAHGPTPVPGIGSVIESEDVGTSAFKYLHMDHRGTVHETTDAGESVKDSYAWNAWGEELQATETGFASRFGYQSNWMRLQDSADLSLSPARTYAPGPGRFAQAERHSGGQYRYARGNPLSMLDPQGQSDVLTNDGPRAAAQPDDKGQLA